MNKILSLIKKPFDAASWATESNEAFKELFGTRYEKRAEKEIQLRTPDFKGDGNVPFSAIIHSSNPTSGGYGGMSFVIFPVKNAAPLIAMGIGTQGLSPDEHIIGKPGHSRKVNAICRWLNNEFGDGKIIAWAKQNAVRIDKGIPENIMQNFTAYNEIFKRYGNVLYGFCIGSEKVAEHVLKAFLDLNFEERGYTPLTSSMEDFNEIKSNYFKYLLPQIHKDEILQLLKSRKYVILQGPPGTGKTRITQEIVREDYKNNGRSIQFHPNTTYETFIGGLFPDINSTNQLGLSFKLIKGSLLDAVEEALKNEKQDYLLVIDEINRADLSKVLGEAIFCLEPFEKRKINLNFNYEGNIGNELILPSNLHILGTMNTADRSISILDIAIRRRFAFLNIWPDITVVEEYGSELMHELFKELLSIFIEYANEDAFTLLPGHSYFITNKKISDEVYLKTSLLPLLNDYLNQGYVSSFGDAIHSYIQRIESL